MENNSKTPRPARRRRARKEDGTFQGDNPATPELNEAWEPTEVAEALPAKPVKYQVKQKVTGMSTDTAGKYSKAKKVSKPTFGNVTTTYN